MNLKDFEWPSAGHAILSTIYFRPVYNYSVKIPGESIRGLLAEFGLGQSNDARARQPHRHRRPAADLALKLELPAMQLDHRFGERQPKPGSLIFSRHSAVDLTKGPERLVEICGG